MLRVLFILTLLAPTSALAASPESCPDSAYDATLPSNWLRAVQNEAQQKGVSQATLDAATPYMVFNAKVISNDRGQRNLGKSFLDFAATAITQRRINTAIAKIKGLQDDRGESVFSKINGKYKVPPAVLAAYWAMESDFGAALGKANYNLISAMTTLAYDCRRPDFFREQLIGLLSIVDRGYVNVDVEGNWAGEIGGMQFIPSLYADYGVAYNAAIYGDGSVPDLANNVPDMLASAANFLNSVDDVATTSWIAGQPWLQQVRVPTDDNFRWELADVSNPLPVEQWAQMGVEPIYSQLPAKQKAALLLPMGRLGPAFLAYPNFINHYLDWNTSLTYSVTAGALANLINSGMNGSKSQVIVAGNGTPDNMKPDDVRLVQQLLYARGETDVAPIDGILGSATRAAIKKYQLKFGLPADSYPDTQFIDKLRTAR